MPAPNVVESRQLIEQLRARATFTPDTGKVYMSLHFGAQDPDAVGDMKGFDGPFIGPLRFMHVVYNNTVNLGFLDGFETGPINWTDGLGFRDDLMCFDGEYYSDWEIQIAR